MLARSVAMEKYVGVKSHETGIAQNQESQLNERGKTTALSNKDISLIKAEEAVVDQLQPPDVR